MTEPRRRDKGRTRARISQEATVRFLARGFDDVTVAEVADAAGVSKVTVFAHFPRKEDLFLDRGPEAVDLLTTAVRDRAAGSGRAQAVRAVVEDLTARRHALLGLTDNSGPFLRTVAASPALQARAREWEAELERVLADVLVQEPDPVGDPRLLASLIMAAVRTVFVAVAEQVLRGDPLSAILADHELRTERAFRVLESAEHALA